MKKHFNKKLVTKEDNENLKTLVNVGFMAMIILIVLLK